MLKIIHVHYSIHYLFQYCSGVIFPEYFYHFLYSYFVSFTGGTQLAPDQRIKKYFATVKII